MLQETIPRHNIIRNCVWKVAEDGLLSPVMEKQGILGPTDPTRRRPGDVSVPVWSNGRGLAIDIAVVCPLAASHLDEAEPGEYYAVSHKHRLYDASFMGSNYDFVPMILETSGGVNQEGEDILKQMFRFASKRSPVSHVRFAGRAWARLSCSLQRAVSQMCLARMLGELQEPEDESLLLDFS